MFPCFGITRGGCLCVLFVVSFFIDHEHYCPAALPPGRILSAPTGAVETMRLQQPTEHTPSASLRSAAFNRGMIATGNHHFERVAALCNTPRGSQGVLTFSVCEPVSGQYRTGRVREPKNWYSVRSGIKNKFTNEGLDFSDTRWYSVFSTQRERVLRKEDGSWN